MSLKDILKREFEGYKKERLEKILEQLEDNGIISEKDICHLDQEVLNNTDLNRVERRKLMTLKDEYENGLHMVIKEIFRGDYGEKIEEIFMALRNFGINQADHLPLGLDLLDSCSEILEIDKNKIKQYVARNFKEKYDEHCEAQRQNREIQNLEKTMRHEVVTKKLDICQTVINYRCQERQQILDHNCELLKAKQQIEENKGFFSFLTIANNKIEALDEMRKDNERRKRVVDEQIDGLLQRFAIISGDQED